MKDDFSILRYEAPIKFQEQCLNALVQISEKKLLSITDIEQWLTVHQILQKRLSDYSLFEKPSPRSRFIHLFKRLKDQYESIFQHENDCLLAMNEYRMFMQSSEENDINWLVKYEALGNKIWVCVGGLLDENIDEMVGGYLLNVDEKVFLRAEDCMNILEFNALFTKLYWDSDYLSKYNIFRSYEDEKQFYLKNNIDRSKHLPLNFYFIKRQEAINSNEPIPFNIFIESENDYYKTK